MASNIPLSMDAARAAKNDKSYTGAHTMTPEEASPTAVVKGKKLAPKSETPSSSNVELSEATKKHLDRAAELRVRGTARHLKVAPKIAYGVADIAAGEKVSGVVALAEVAPDYVKGQVDKTKANVETVKALHSANKDMKGKPLGEKMKMQKAFIKENFSTTKEATLNAPASTIDDAKASVNAVKDVVSGEKGVKDVMDEKSAKKALEKQEDKAKDEELKALDKQQEHQDTIDKTVDTKDVVVSEPAKSKVDPARMQQDANRLTRSLDYSSGSEMQFQ